MLENQVKIGDKIVDIKPVKMKYIKDNFYAYFELIRKEKLNLFRYTDGLDIFDKFLNAVFDGDEDLIKYITDELDLSSLNELLKQVRKVNEFPTDEELKNE